MSYAFFSPHLSLSTEDDLDSRWEEATGEAVDEVIFLSRHTTVSNRPAMPVHPIGVLHLKEGESPSHGGKPGWAALRIGLPSDNLICQEGKPQAAVDRAIDNIAFRDTVDAHESGELAMLLGVSGNTRAEL
uniref:Uncharacterized protein n=1 Tax=Brassica oleracea var. oleracea TaxID=109376 RepID=A0A0D3AMC0_BRAOL